MVTDKQTLRRRLFAGIAAFVGFLGGLIAVWAFTPIQQTACESRVGDAISGLCADDFKTVSSEDADLTIRAFLAKYMSADGPMEAWAIFTPQYRDAHSSSQQQFESDSAELFWIEETGHAIRKPETANSFTYNVRRYFKGPDGDPYDGFVQDFGATVTLQYHGDQIQIDQYHDDGRISEGQSTYFARATLQRPENVYKFPHVRSTTVMYAGTDITVGGQLTTLCNAQLSPAAASHSSIDPEDEGWWTRIPQGWIRSAAFAKDPQGSPQSNANRDFAALPMCDASSLQVQW